MKVKEAPGLHQSIFETAPFTPGPRVGASGEPGIRLREVMSKLASKIGQKKESGGASLRPSRIAPSPPRQPRRWSVKSPPSLREPGSTSG